MLGYGWAGIFRRFLVDSPYMWWPSNLVQVSLFRYSPPSQIIKSKPFPILPLDVFWKVLKTLECEYL